MREAIRVADSHQTPFGAVLAMGEEIFATAHNQTGELKDPTAHAEIQVIRKLCDQLQSTDLSGYTLYTTCEPCPMCASAAVWSGIPAIVYGCSIPEILNFMRQINLRSEEIVKKGGSGISIEGGFMREECMSLLKRHSTA